MNMLEFLRQADGGVLYAGASVTAQQGGYRPEFHKMLERECGRPVPAYTNALGGVGSLFGVANLNLLRAEYGRINLAIIEYSTGDLNLWITPKPLISEVVKELVLLVCQMADCVLVLHNYRSDFDESTGAVIRDIYDEIAADFDVPVVHMHKVVAGQIQAGVLEFDKIYRDHVHPNQLGAEVIARNLLDALKSIHPRAGLPALIEAPTTPIICSDLGQYSGGVGVSEFTYSSTGQTFPYLEIDAAGQLEIVVSGAILGIVLILGPRSANLDIIGDHGVHTVSAFDRNCYYRRPHCMPYILDCGIESVLTLSPSTEPVDPGILKRPHPDSAAPRQIQICALVGRGVSIKSWKLTS
jgi:hypothetical protein